MFSRIREAIRIVNYREPHNGADAVIVEQTPATSRPTGKLIASLIEWTLLVYSLAYIAGIVSDRLTKFVPATRSVSIGTIAGAVGVLLALVLHSLRDDIERKLRSRIDLAELLAPYFGHRLDYTIRVLKG